MNWPIDLPLTGLAGGVFAALAVGRPGWPLPGKPGRAHATRRGGAADVTGNDSRHRRGTRPMTRLATVVGAPTVSREAR